MAEAVRERPKKKKKKEKDRFTSYLKPGEYACASLKVYFKLFR